MDSICDNIHMQNKQKLPLVAVLRVYVCMYVELSEMPAPKPSYVMQAYGKSKHKQLYKYRKGMKGRENIHESVRERERERECVCVCVCVCVVEKTKQNFKIK